MRKKKRGKLRFTIYCILLSISMLLTLLSVPALAAEPVETGAGYEQEQEQQQEQTQEQEQEQQQEQTTGTGTVSGNDAMESEEAQPTACTHVCSEESSGINVENTLRANGLPIVMAPNNRGDVELKQDTIENYRVQSTSGGIFYRLPPGNYRLGENITLDKELEIGEVLSPYTVSLDLNGHKLEMGDNVITLLASSELNIKNTGQQEGEIINGSKRGIRINEDAKLRIYGGTIDSIITYSGNAEFYLYGGTIKRNIQFSETIQSIPNAVLYANGGIVEGDLPINIYQNDKLTIRTEKSAASMTTFRGFVMNCKIEGGIFSGAVDGSCQIEDSAKVTVEFDTKGVGTFPQQKVLRGQKAQDPGVPVQVGYAFDGWYVSGNPNPKWDFSDCVTDNLNLEAHWNKVYQVTLQTNGGTIAAGREIKSYTEGTTSTLPGGGDIIRKGYTFEGWYTDSGFSGVPVTEISSTDTGDKIFYAKWSAKTYIVKLETNGGKIADGKDVTDYTCGTGAALPGAGDITRGGYTFEGWYEDIDFSGVPVTEISSTDTGDKIFYAKWSAKTYIVKLETNGGKIADGKDVTDYTCGTGAALPGAGDITRGGYTFEGWYEDIDFSGVPVTEISSTDTGDKIFYAKWKQNIAPVTPAQTEHNDANHDNTNHDNTGDTNESGGTPPAIYPALTFDTCGGSSIKAVRAFEGHMINLSVYQPTREGYEFSGWYADRNLTQPITEIRLNGNRTVYAGWIKQAEQTGENYKKKAAPAQLIADNSEKAANKDSGQYLIEDYEPGATDTPEDMEDQSTEDQATEDQTTGDQRTEDTGDDQKSTVENNPADNSPVDNDSKQDDSANLTSEDSSHSGGWIPVICISAGALVIGPLLYLGFRKWKKIDRK